MRKPAKAGSNEHHRRISEGLKEHHRKSGGARKPSLISRWLRNRNHPANVTHRKVQNDPELKAARKVLRKAEGDLAANKSKLPPEKLAAIRDKFRKAQENENRAHSAAMKRHHRT